MGKAKRGKQRKEFDTMVFPRYILRWEKSALLRKRNWIKLPTDILVMIFQKMGPINILTKAIRVCRDWLELARSEPLLWRKVDMTCHGNKFGPKYLEDIACIAVNWSAGQLEEFSAEKFGSADLLQYIADSTSNLKSIRLIRPPVLEKELEKIIKRWPLLEEIELTRYLCSPELCQTIGLLCPRLKCFKLNEIYFGGYSREKNLIANCIGSTMPNLHSLQLINYRITNEGLHAILEGCPQLKSLDVRKCCELTIDESIMSELERIKNLRLPDDSTDNCEFCHHVRSPFCRCRDWDWSDSDIPSDYYCDCGSDFDNYFGTEYEHDIFDIQGVC